jgi:hypothetical protein
MLDLDDPGANRVLAAARQLDFILDLAKRLTTQRDAWRTRVFHIIQPAFAALRWLNAKHYGTDPEISAAVEQLESSVTQLATLVALPSGENDIGEFSIPSQCPVCSAGLMMLSEDPHRAYCSACLDRIIPSLTHCESLFGTDGI